jgi:signal transduction histidine kinase
MEAAPETVPEGAARVLGDRDALAIVYGNLIENAVKYTPDGGQVSVRVSREGIYVSAAVSDTGIGMSEEEQGKAFDEFYRARNEHTASIPGTGLGLALVKRLTELHQGRVALASEPGKGSRFTVSIPASGEG